MKIDVKTLPKQNDEIMRKVVVFDDSHCAVIIILKPKIGRFKDLGVFQDYSIHIEQWTNNHGAGSVLANRKTLNGARACMNNFARLIKGN